MARRRGVLTFFAPMLNTMHTLDWAGEIPVRGFDGSNIVGFIERNTRRPHVFVVRAVELGVLGWVYVPMPGDIRPQPPQQPPSSLHSKRFNEIVQRAASRGVFGGRFTGGLA
jgi:hypothetical protein